MTTNLVPEVEPSTCRESVRASRVGRLRSGGIVATFAVLCIAGACGDASDELSPTEAEMSEMQRQEAVTDLVVTMTATATESSVIAEGVVTNAGRNMSAFIRVRFEVPTGLTTPDPLPVDCTADGSTLECNYERSLLPFPPEGSSDVEHEIRFQFELPIDAPALPATRSIELSAIVTAEDLDLDNDSDPNNNTATVAISVP